MSDSLDCDTGCRFLGVTLDGIDQRRDFLVDDTAFDLSVCHLNRGSNGGGHGPHVEPGRELGATGCRGAVPDENEKLSYI